MSRITFAPFGYEGVQYKEFMFPGLTAPCIGVTAGELVSMKVVNEAYNYSRWVTPISGNLAMWGGAYNLLTGLNTKKYEETQYIHLPGGTSFTAWGKTGLVLRPEWIAYSATFPFDPRCIGLFSATDYKERGVEETMPLAMDLGPAACPTPIIDNFTTEVATYLDETYTPRVVYLSEVPDLDSIYPSRQVYLVDWVTVLAPLLQLQIQAIGPIEWGNSMGWGAPVEEGKTLFPHRFTDGTGKPIFVLPRR